MVRTNPPENNGSAFKRTTKPKYRNLIGNKNAVGNPGGGHPFFYKPEYARQAFKLCLLGATNEDLAEFFEVSHATIDNWVKTFPDFKTCVREGKKIADAEVAHSLYRRALGYSHLEEKIFQHEGKIIRTNTTKQYPPETQAIQLWLMNRQPTYWKDRKTLELIGQGGGPIKHEHEFTDETIKAAYGTLYRNIISGNGTDN